MGVDIYEDFEEIRVKDVYIVDVFTDPTPVVLLENMDREYASHIHRASRSPLNRKRA